MKYHFIVFLCFSLQLSAQLKENFESSDLSHWKESAAGRWSVSSDNPVSGNFSLQHTFNNINNDNDRISLLHHPLYMDSANTCWRFSIRHEYEPSSYNNWAVFLAANHDACEMHPSGNVHAVILGVNYTGDDDLVKLWETKSNETTETFSTGYNWQTFTGTDRTARFEVERTKNGEWKIWIELHETGAEKKLIAEFSDTTGLKTSNYFGLYYKYSASQDRKLWFDDLEIEGCFIPDTQPPKLIETEIPDNKNIIIRFNENVFCTDDLKIEITANLKSVAYDSVSITGNTLVVSLSEDISDLSEVYLKITGIKDVYGNISPVFSSNIIFYRPKVNDIIITEIMADPTPAVMLPEVEYIEILNRSGYPVNLKEWQLMVGNSCTILGSYALQPGQYLLLCESPFVELFPNSIAKMGLPSFPQLPNTGQAIILKDREQQIIHGADYNIKWYRDHNKSDGGWALEMIDTENPCGEAKNWKASDDAAGGTPGLVNSVLSTNPDFEAPELLKCTIISDTCLYLVFSEIVTGNNLLNTTTYSVDNGMGNPLYIITGKNPRKHLQLLFEEPFSANITYTLQISNEIEDCAGNVIQKNLNYSFKKPSRCDSLNLVINEILFDPYETEGDFIELYNNSGKTIDLKGFSVALKNSYTEKSGTRYTVVSYPYTIEPDCYAVLCKYPRKVTAYYSHCPLNSLIEMGNFPSLPNESGVIVIQDSAGSIIDEVAYLKDFHFSLASNTKGVSLERIRSGLSSCDPENWHSASGDAGYATPGLINSQNNTDDQPDYTINVEPKIFTPDGSGLHNTVTISYTMPDNGYVASIIILDRTGRPVKKLALNTIIGTSGSYIWDGKTDNNYIAPVGPYLIYTEVYNLSGMVKKFKNTCIIAERIY